MTQRLHSNFAHVHCSGWFKCRLNELNEKYKVWNVNLVSKTKKVSKTFVKLSFFDLRSFDN